MSNGSVPHAIRFGLPRFGKTFADIPERPLDALRTPLDKAAQIVGMLAEGVGIRATARLANVHRDTVLAILETAGQKCARLLDEKLRNIQAEHVEIDETWAFVYCKQAIAQPDTEEGDQYTWLAIERNTKLIIHWQVAKRNQENADQFLRGLKARLACRVQLSSDGYDAYCGRKYNQGGVERIFGDEVDYGTEIKRYGWDAERERRYSAPPCIGVKRRAILGNPDRDTITTSHAERLNLNARLFNRRLTRLTLGFSKRLANHRHATSIFVAFSNFCRKHGTIKQTPAQAAKITDHQWTVAELLSAAV